MPRIAEHRDVTVKRQYSCFTYCRHHVISVRANSTRQLHVLHRLENNDYSLDFWSEPSLVRPTHIRVPPTLVDTVTTLLRREGFKPETIQSDLQRLIDQENGAGLSSYSTGGQETRRPETHYLTFTEIESFLKNLTNEYPERVELKSLGETYEKRPIYRIKISSDLNATDKPVVWIQAMTHAREWITGAATLYTIKRLAQQSDEESREMLANFDWHIIPVHNPDGYVYTHTSDRMWRKNRNPNKRKKCRFLCGLCYGTDLNRNWDINWGGVGSSSNKCSQTFRGIKAFSEQETRAVRDAVLSTPNNRMFFSVHAYSQLILIPDGFRTEKPDDFADLKRVADRASGAMYNVNGERYQTGTSADLLYIASGNSEDYMRKADGPGIKWSFTYELRPDADSTHNGFLLDRRWIIPTAKELFASFYTFAAEISNVE
ncbi:hypothetical protein ScPMuIL_002423 [Solemya velum]